MNWKRLGKRFELRKRRLKLLLSYKMERLRMRRIELELRYLEWKHDKLETLNELADSKAFQYGWDDE